MKKLVLFSAAAAMVLASCVGNPEGKKADVTDSVETTDEVLGHVYTVDASQSELVWTGAKVTGQHHGTVDIKSGELHVDEGTISGGKFVLDMNSINTQDLEGEWKDKLDGHLKSEDFFDVASNPEASFEVTSVAAGATEGTLTVSGNLTIKGVSKNITFDANVEELTDATAKVTADFNIAREDWGVSYEGQKDDLISKEINFKVTLVAKK
jgi:polyisoprenoid-binding protein YceI